jgi:phosphate transport system substrate-binding protein
MDKKERRDKMGMIFGKLSVVNGIVLTAMLVISSSLAMAEEIRVVGAGAAMSSIFSPIKESFEKSTGHTLKLTVTSPAKSIISLWKGEADIAAAAVEPNDIIKAAAKEGVTIDPATIESFVIGQDRTVVFIDKSNRVKSLSKKQLKDIFSGKITNWKEVGGADCKIIVVWGNTPGQNAAFIHKIMDGEAVTSEKKVATDYANIREVVANTTCAIGIDTHGLLNASVNSPETPVLLRPINIYTKGKPSDKAHIVLDYYREEFGFFEN